MRGWISLLCVLAVLAAGSGLAGEARFVSVIDDLPLMDGLVEVGDGMQFSGSDGRIAEVTASGLVSRGDVLAFYARTLPQLGWTAASKTAFKREGEELKLLFETQADGLRVRFSLAPEK
ncbi:MAG: hypothetical protein HQL36_09845 [Alphaproteobacteria bacterium]|nr:hypothetical protein [Alphaproteobacteria bacterium]MBF0251583.1 hypothetical protein [Alphaproteobacteria bacterium]